MSPVSARAYTTTVFLFLYAAALPGQALAQDLPRRVQAGAKAEVHQFAIIRDGRTELKKQDLLDLPEFVHTADQTSATTHTWLDFSALYIIPPQMTTAPLMFQVRQQIPRGAITAWYPYATSNALNQVTWTDINVGVRADGLETTHTAWMTARSMEAAATVKVYKPGPPGSRQDDVGTTEGDVFLFARSQAPLAAPVFPEFDSKAGEWTLTIASVLSDPSFAFTPETRNGWIAQADANGEILSRRIELGAESGGPVKTSATVRLESYSRQTADLRAQLNEAIVGNGLRPDEAAAQAELLLLAVRNMDEPVLIYLLPPDWIEMRFRLAIDGPAEKPVRVFVVIQSLPTK